MSSTEAENVVLSQSRAVGLKESEAEVESVVEPVVQGERTVNASDEVEGGEAGVQVMMSPWVLDLERRAVRVRTVKAALGRNRTIQQRVTVVMISTT